MYYPPKSLDMIVNNEYNKFVFIFYLDVNVGEFITI